ncbi:hypothetical protein [Stenotrophomonas maltophilia]|uniref:hypothetical protein n=1 Tax=Stenotrophomonas maltophilia TaxID=40324 RepID=UPI0028942740|nr:hypothetical protein [Stenotrophomonas maltophilia]MDT3499704.1 hypothetical protein [Stenotrophomonas maltophilia]
MRESSDVLWVAGALAIPLALFAWWLSLKSGLNFEVILTALVRVLGVLALYGLASWLASSLGYSNPWQFLVPGLWFASWPALIAKGASTPEFFVLRGADPALDWWATPAFLWGMLAALVVGASWLYVKANRYR